MDQNTSNALDDVDEFELDDHDEFHQDIQMVYYQTERDARRGVLSLQNAGYRNIIITQLSFVTWTVEGRR